LEYTVPINPIDGAPWIRKLAEAGVEFRDAIAASGFVSIATGLLPAGPESSNWA